ncbi:uncharacterized protein V1510DRAFT_418387 [Dipodascopsis tothii]|uniref:uncharacterized protein n=1 Tax=Dipodascopsis tothii TaxID=44089 RepID=UPI0034CD3867
MASLFGQLFSLATGLLFEPYKLGFRLTGAALAPVVPLAQFARSVVTAVVFPRALTNAAGSLYLFAFTATVIGIAAGVTVALAYRSMELVLDMLMPDKREKKAAARRHGPLFARAIPPAVAAGTVLRSGRHPERQVVCVDDADTADSGSFCDVSTYDDGDRPLLRIAIPSPTLSSSSSSLSQLYALPETILEEEEATEEPARPAGERTQPPLLETGPEDASEAASDLVVEISAEPAFDPADFGDAFVDAPGEPLAADTAEAAVLAPAGPDEETFMLAREPEDVVMAELSTDEDELQLLAGRRFSSTPAATPDTSLDTSLDTVIADVRADGENVAPRETSYRSGLIAQPKPEVFQSPAKPSPPAKHRKASKHKSKHSRAKKLTAQDGNTSRPKRVKFVDASS